MTTRIPEPEDHYQHHNGNTYEVIIVANLESDRPEYPATVVYSGTNGKVWAKTLENFNKTMTFLSGVQSHQ